MFTGIIEAQAELLSIVENGTNKTFRFRSPIGNELRVDQSLSHNGVCLTVELVEGSEYEVTAILETLQRSNLNELRPGDKVNLERCMAANGRFDGHIVQGHVDQTAVLKNISDQNGSYLLGFKYNTAYGHLTVDKGSVCVNGISLTVVQSLQGYFSVAIIPYTWLHTNLQALKPGDTVNLEFDIVGKYIQKILNQNT